MMLIIPAIPAAGAAWTAISAIGTTAIAYAFYWSTKNDLVNAAETVAASQTSATQNTEQEDDKLEDKLESMSTFLIYGLTGVMLLVAYKYLKKLLKF